MASAKNASSARVARKKSSVPTPPEGVKTSSVLRPPGGAATSAAPAQKTPPAQQPLGQETEALRQLMGESATVPKAAEPEPVTGVLHYEEPIVQIAPTALALPSDNVRKSMDPEDIVALQASLAQQGMMHPVIVEPLPNKTRGFRYRLVAGYRRTAAAQALSSWTHVPARVLTAPLTDDERTVVQMTENLQRESMRLRDVVNSVQALRQAGKTSAEMAQPLGMSRPRLHLYQQLGDVLTIHPKM